MSDNDLGLIADPVTDKFNKAFDFTAGQEGGYTVDNGGPTMGGITQKTADSFNDKYSFPRQNVKDMTEDDRKFIYKKQYFEEPGLHKLPDDVATAAFDYGVNSGPGQAIKDLQRTVGAKPDGVLGPNSVKAVDQYIDKNGQQQLLQDYTNRRQDFYDNLVNKDPDKYRPSQNGWDNRINAIKSKFNLSSLFGEGTANADEIPVSEQDKDLGLQPDKNVSRETSQAQPQANTQVGDPKDNDLGLKSDMTAQSLKKDYDDLGLVPEAGQGDMFEGPKDEWYSGAARSITNAADAFMSHFKKASPLGIGERIANPSQDQLSTRDKADSKENPAAAFLGEAAGGALTFGGMAAIPEVSLPVAFGAASALSGVADQADTIKDANNQLTVGQRIGKVGVDAAAGAVTGKIFATASAGDTILDRVIERSGGAGATAITQSVANQAVEGKDPDVGQALAAGGLQAVSIGIISGMTEVPQLRGLIMDEAADIARTNRGVGKMQNVDPDNLSLDQAKSILTNASINPESLSPEFQQAHYDIKRQVALDNIDVKAKEYGVDPDILKQVVNAQGVRAREDVLTQYLTSMVKTDPKSAEKLLPFFDAIKNGADPVDVLIMSDILKKFSAGTKIETGIDTPQAKAMEAESAKPAENAGNPGKTADTGIETPAATAMEMNPRNIIQGATEGAAQPQVIQGQPLPENGQPQAKESGFQGTTVADIRRLNPNIKTDEEAQAVLDKIGTKTDDGKVSGPRTLGGLVQKFGGMDFNKAPEIANEDKKGLWFNHRAGAQSPDALAKEMIGQGILPEGTTGDTLMRKLREDSGKLLPQVKADETDYEAEYKQWQERNKDANDTEPIPEDAIRGAEADLEKEGARKTPEELLSWLDEEEQPAKDVNQSKDKDLGLIPDEPKFKTEQPFYSQAAKVIDEKMPNAATPEMVRGILSEKNGIKADELQWMGLDNFLAGKTKISRAELQDFIKNNQVNVTEKIKGARDQDYDQAFENYNNYVNELKATHDSSGRMNLSSMIDSALLSGDESRKLRELDHEVKVSRGKDVKFSSYQLPGGENYRELLLTLPSIEPVKETFSIKQISKNEFVVEKHIAGDVADQEIGIIHDTREEAEKYLNVIKKEPAAFRSSHFEEPNILAHVRMNDRTDADGNKVLFIEEVQSDWHQKGRKHGYETKLSDEQRVEKERLDKRYNELQRDLGRPITDQELEKYYKLGNIVKGYSGWDKVIAYHMGKNNNWHVEVVHVNKDGSPIAGEYNRVHATNPDITEIRKGMKEELDQTYDELIKLTQLERGGVPEAPFKKTWQELAMKRMLRYAAEHSYDKLAWTTGAQQADRYDLSKHVDEIDVARTTDGKYILYARKNGDNLQVIRLKDLHDLENHIGKDAAQKIEEQYAKNPQADNAIINGQDLKVGGEGMKGFYDQILPSFMNKYAKKWGGRVGKTIIETTQQDEAGTDLPYLSQENVHSIDITPSMRASVINEGQPLFKKAPTWESLKKDKEAYAAANKAGAELIKKYVPQLEKSLVNVPYLMTKEGKKALGMYFRGEITVKTGAGKNVYVHELGHAVFDMFLTPEEKADLLAEGRTIYGNNADVEERIMLDFEKYYKDNELIPDTSLWGKIKSYFKRLGDRLDEFFGSDRGLIRSFYNAILEGKYAQAQPVKDFDNTAKFKEEQGAKLPGQGILDPAIAAVAKSYKEVIALLAPRSLVARPALDELMKMKGQRDKLEFVLESGLIKLEKAFDKMPMEEKVAFVDNIKLGKPQATPDLDKVASMMRTVEDQHWAMAKVYKPSLAYKENHFRVMWKVIPGSDSAKGGFHGLFKRPFQGSQGWAKKSTLVDMSEGIEKGGVPYSFNPVTMWRNSIMDMQKFITARRMWESMKKMGFVKFVRVGGSAPANMIALEDSIAHVYFPLVPEDLKDDAKLKEIMDGMQLERIAVEIGKYYVDANVGRVLNNFLGPDYIRQSAIGGNLLAFKNLTTGIELSLSPFHAAYVSLMAGSSSIGLGLQKIANRGVIQADGGAFLDGLKDMAYGAVPLAAPVRLANIGAQAIKLVSHQEFINTKAGQDFIKHFPDAKELIDDLFTGGGKLAIHQDYKITSLKAFTQGIRDFTDAKNSFKVAQANGNTALMQKYAVEMAKNAWAEVIHALPSVNQWIMKFLFEIYIPRLKVGAFLKEYSNDLVARRDQLESGRLTRAQLARDTWDSIERRFGEMNFDNLFWNRNFKTANQLLFRSVTWKLGALQNIGGAGTGTIADLKIAYEDKALPKLNRNLAMLFGLALMVTVFAEVTQKLLNGHHLGQRNDGQFDTHLLMKDMLDPRYDKHDNRLFFNTHLKDWAHLAHSPWGFLSNSLSGMIGRAIEDWNNKDFFNTQIHDPKDPAGKQAFDLIRHMIPLPFMVTNQGQLKLQHAPLAVKALTAAGFTTPAPGYVNETPVLALAKEIMKNKPYSNITKTQAQTDKSKMMGKLKAEYAETQDPAPLREAEKAGKITFAQYLDIKKTAGQSPLLNMTKHFTFDDTAQLLQKAIETKSVDEQQVLWPVVRQKFFSAQERGSAFDRQQNKDIYNDIKSKLGK